MYVTRPLSLYKNSPESLSIPPEGPNSGFLVLQDEEAVKTSFCGFSKSHVIKELPLPQNRDLNVRYLQNYGTFMTYISEEAIFIPVLNQPLSSNLYYVIHQEGKNKGEAYTCSKEEDKRRNCCLVKCINDVKPKPLDPNNIYQQINISHYKNVCTRKGGFHATSVAPDGYPPQVLRNKGWDINAKFPKTFRLGEALGLNTPLRSRLPKFDFTIQEIKFAPVTVGKWNIPFIFIKDGNVRDQMHRSVFYEMTLEQRWERIYTCSNDRNTHALHVELEIQNETVLVSGNEAKWDPQGDVDGIVWFNGIGLNVAIIERMKWEQERGGWREVKGNVVKVNRVEEFLGFGDWNKFGCYILVERFVLKRMDGSLVLTYEFKHTHQTRTKWE